MPARQFRWPFQSAGKALPSEVVEAAWREWHAARAPAARDTLVERYIHLVRYMANRLSRALPPAVEIDDLVSAGAVGFLHALESFDPSHGVEFSVHALTRIRGAMVDFIRQIDPLGRVTRSRLRAIERALTLLEQELSRPPTDEEAAHRLGMPLDTYHGLLTHATAAVTLALDRVESAGDDDGDPTPRARIADVGTADPLSALLGKDGAGRLAALVGALSPAQQLVLHLHYVEELNFREIAMVMDISESRATQHHSAAILALRGTVRAGAALWAEAAR
jgi:RNA polymerase sigma factor FliA